MRRYLAAFLLVLAPIASASITFDPPLVHENEAFDILFRSISGSAPPPGAPYLRLGPGQITVDLMRAAGPLTVVVPFGERVRVDGVPAGTYEVALRTADRELERTTLVVDPRPFSITPAFGDGNTEVLIEGVHTLCTGSAPCPLAVRFGGEEALGVRVTDEGDIAATTPVVLGTVDVTVEVNGVTRTLAGGYTGMLSGAQPDLALMEKVLLPLNFRGNGAHGSDWRTETVVRNDAVIRVPTEPLIFVSDLGGGAPIPRAVRAPFPEEAVEGGVYLFVARGLEKRLTWKSHVIDRSRSATDRGTELPVIRVEDTSAELRLIDVPLRSLFRARLRIYDFDTVADREIDVVVTREDGTATRFTAVTHVPGCVSPPCAMYRAPFAAYDLSSMPGLGDAGDVDITIRAKTNDARLWAFVSVSNNETQRVTLYTPLHQTPGVTR